MIKFDKLKIFIISFIFLIIAVVLYFINNSNSDLIKSLEKGSISISIKDQKEIKIGDNDPINFEIFRKINTDSDINLKFNKENGFLEFHLLNDDLIINENKINQSPYLIHSIKMNIGGRFLFADNNLEITENTDFVTKSKDVLNNPRIQKIDKNEKLENLIKNQNNSFENGLWSKKADVCEVNNKNKSKVDQKEHYNCSDGKKCLELISYNNTACASSFFTIDLKKGDSYKISFDYKKIEGNNASTLFVLMGDTGQNYYFTSNLNPTENFKTFSYSTNTLKENIVGIVFKLNSISLDGSKNSIIFDNISIYKEDDKISNIEINKDLFNKEIKVSDVVLKKDINKIIFKSLKDTQLSKNSDDYYFKFKDESGASSFFNKIKLYSILKNITLFFIVLFSSLSVVYGFLLIYKKLLELFINAINKIKCNVLNLFKDIFNYFKNKFIEIKNTKKIILVIKIVLIVGVFGFYITYNIINNKPINPFSAIALFYALNSFAFVLDSRISALFALIYLISCPILLILKDDKTAENMAVQAYYFLVITVVNQIIENKIEDKNKNINSK